MTTLEQINTILFEHDYLESNIATGHCYWDLLTKYRAGVEDAPMCVFNEPHAAPPPPPQAQDKIRLAALRKTVRDTLTAYGGLESNIPFTHEYWFTQNVIKSIERQPE
jgi:hypothetical protein